MTNPLHLTWHVPEIQIPVFDGTRCYDKHRDRYIAQTWNVQLIIESWNTMDFKSGAKGSLSSGRAILSNLSKLLDTGANADVQFVFKESKIAAHSAIIAASSPVFATMFQQGKFKEAHTKTVDIEDVDPHVFRQLLQFLYSGQAPEWANADVMEPLFLAADKYQVDALKSLCEDCLISKLKFENAIRYLVLAHLHSAPKLQQAAVKCLRAHRNELWKLAEWKEFNRNYTDLFHEVCQRICTDPSENANE
jgi:DNA-binding transcriptional regulator/RsmH inhibitor MraZ